MTDQSKTPEFKAGADVHVVRGKNRGPATVIGVNASTYVVQTPAGEFVRVDHTNVKALPERTYTADEIREAIQAEARRWVTGEVNEALENLAERLEVEVSLSQAE
jgi:hypothetical protein